jgi:hypothetical protein
MRWIFTHLRIISLVLLLIGMFLPFSSCTNSYDAAGKLVMDDSQVAIETVTEVYYVWDQFDDLDGATLMFVVAILWPLVAAYYYHRGTHPRLQITRRVLEPILSLLSLLFIFVAATFLTTPRIGAYVLLSAYILFLIAWIGEMWQLWRHRTRASPGKEA